MNNLARIADRVIGRPLLLHPAKAELIASVLADRIGIEAMIDPRSLSAEFTAPMNERPAANRMVGEAVGNPRAPLYTRTNGVGIIPVVGSLVNRGVGIGEDSSGFTSYEGIAVQLRAAMADPLVQSIILDMDSPGGEATGMFSLSSAIRAARSQKPIVAVIDDMAASAAYGLASSATEIVISPTSITGSIGVVMMHLDKSAEMEMKGRKPTMIYAGAHKVDGHPFGPLSSSVRADLQREVDTFYARFVEQVAEGRPKLTQDAIRGTEARIYIGSEAMAVGLADRMGTFDETLARLSSANNVRTHTGDTVMSQAPETIARADHEAAVAAARSEGRAEGEAAGRAQAIARVQAILTSPEAEGRTAQAMVFALESDLSPEVAAKALAASPAAAKGVPALEARNNPAFVAAGAPQNTNPDPKSAWDRSLKRAGAKLPATA